MPDKNLLFSKNFLSDSDQTPFYKFAFDGTLPEVSQKHLMAATQILDNLKKVQLNTLDMCNLQFETMKNMQNNTNNNQGNNNKHNKGGPGGQKNNNNNNNNNNGGKNWNENMNPNINMMNPMMMGANNMMMGMNNNPMMQQQQQQTMNPTVNGGMMNTTNPMMNTTNPMMNNTNPMMNNTNSMMNPSMTMGNTGVSNTMSTQGGNMMGMMGMNPNIVGGGMVFNQQQIQNGMGTNMMSTVGTTGNSGMMM